MKRRLEDFNLWELHFADQHTIDYTQCSRIYSVGSTNTTIIHDKLSRPDTDRGGPKPNKGMSRCFGGHLMA